MNTHEISFAVKTLDTSKTVVCTCDSNKLQYKHREWCIAYGLFYKFRFYLVSKRANNTLFQHGYIERLYPVWMFSNRPSKTTALKWAREITAEYHGETGQFVDGVEYRGIINEEGY